MDWSGKPSLSLLNYSHRICDTANSYYRLYILLGLHAIFKMIFNLSLIISLFLQHPVLSLIIKGFLIGHGLRPIESVADRCQCGEGGGNCV